MQLRLRRPRTVLWALITVLAALVGGCGPGVGGTGTGDTAGALDHFGAGAASVCSSELAALLACPAPASSSASTASPAPLYLADALENRHLQGRLEGDAIDLTAPCVPLHFRGVWGVAAGQAGRYYGYIDPDAAPAPATLEVQANGPGLQLKLRDAGGRVLLGPVAVTVVAAPAAPGGCS